MQLPGKLLQSLEGIRGFNKEAFERAHDLRHQVTSIRINPSKLSATSKDLLPGGDPREIIPWTEYGYYLENRPSFTFDPLFHAGCYYVQEASSMFLEQVLKQNLDLSQPVRILDLAAAPGGKSTHIHSLISNHSLLVSNEVIRNRANILKDNIIKWGPDNVVVTNNDARDFARLENYFDVIVADAPCSGSGLFRREQEAVEEWSENNVQLCSRRQKRILADAWPALKKDGILIYSTCSYSKEEDEEILEWLGSEFSTQNSELRILNGWNIIESSGGYRFWPDKVKGEGFFVACLKKLNGGNVTEIRTKRKMEFLNEKEMETVKDWVRKTDHQFVKVDRTVYAVPQTLLNDVNFLSGNLHVIYFGTMIGTLMREKLIPAHAFAMSLLLADKIEKTELNHEQAIAFLKKKELKGTTAGKGWKLVMYRDHPLGWINVLSSRINNYYPKELRILKDI